MSRAAVVFLAVLVCLLTATPGGAAEGHVIAVGEVVPDSYVVVLRADVGATANVAASYGGTVTATWSRALNGFAARMSESQAKRLAADPRVASVQQDQVVRATDRQPDPPSWGLDRVDQRDRPLDRSYTQDSTASDVHVYVIDTGIRLSHNTFGGRANWGVNTIDAIDTDCNGIGHGTHVAGTVGGREYGVAKGVTLTAVKVLGCDGLGTASSVISGVEWVTRNAARPAVANMSLGGGASAPIDLAVANSIASGITYTVASGNYSLDACGFSPARVPTAITVNATDVDDRQYVSSNYGTCTDLFAPGVGIISAGTDTDDAQRNLTGTSMAAPHVAGAAALWLARHPTDTPAQVTAALLAATTPGLVSDAGPGSPNLLLYTAPGGGLAGRPLLTDPGRQSAVVGTAVDLQLTVDDGTAPYAWTAVGLPAGLSLDGATGRITGTPTNTGQNTATMTLTDAGGLTASTAFPWSVVPSSRITVRNNGSTLCLTPLSASTAANAQVGQFGCDIDPARNWTLVPSPLGGYYVQNARSGLCLTMAGGAVAAAVTAVQYYCDTNRSRTWQVVRSGTALHLRNLASGLCATIPAGTNAVAAQDRCDTDPARLWELTPYPAYEEQQVRNTQSSLCLSPTGGGTAPNVQVVQFTCDIDPARRWTLVPSSLGGYYVQNAKSGLCLTVAGGAATPDAAAVQYHCDTDPSRRWTTVASGSALQLKNVNSNLCLSITATTTNSVALQQSCGTTASRLWQTLPYPIYEPVYARNSFSALCLSPAGGDTATNAKIVQFTCDIDPARRWTLVPSPLGGNYLQNTKSGLCLTIAGGATTINATAVQYNCDTDSSRRWTTVASGNAAQLKNVKSGLCLAVTNGASNSLAVQQPCDTNTVRLWQLR